MKILFLPNWTVHKLEIDDINIQSPNKQIAGEPYWFFKHFPEKVEIDIIDIQQKNFIYKIEKKIKFYIYQALLAFAKAKEYDVVISHGAQSGLVYALLSLFRRKKSRPLHIIIDIGGLNGGRSNKIETTGIKFALKSSPAIIYHASIQKELYKTVYKGVIKQFDFIRFGVNTEEFHPLNLKTEDYILSFGYCKRDYPTLLKAWEQITTDTRLYIIGDETAQGIKNVVAIPKIDIIKLKQYIAKSLFVVIPLPVFNYSYGQMSFLQSMAMGKPVIVTKTPSSIDYIEDGKGVFFVRPYDISDLKSKIEYLLSQRNRLAIHGENAYRQIIDNLLDEETMSRKIAEFIKLLISN
jgi:glycosyltransferase involved in cell wall biosynthesis